MLFSENKISWVGQISMLWGQNLYSSVEIQGCGKLFLIEVGYDEKPTVSRQRYFRNHNNKECYNLFGRKILFI